MGEQTALFAVEPQKANNLRRRWENGFQKWSNKHGNEGYTEYGACGFGIICDYCKDNHYGRPCVRALNAMCRESHITIDYEKTSYENAWEGVFDNG